MTYWWIVPVVVVLAVAGYLLWRRMRAFGREVAVERARELFKLQRERLEAQFLTAAAATGKPRGLRWKDCQWDDSVEFVRERETRQIHALLGVTIAFEAIEGATWKGSPPSVTSATRAAVFVFTKGRWFTHGKTVFNLNPDEAVKHFASQYEKLI